MNDSQFEPPVMNIEPFPDPDDAPDGPDNTDAPDGVDDGDPPPDRPLTKSEEKLQRWVDLLAALLVRHTPANFETLAPDVPGYDLAGGKRESVLRTFERDKDELRRFGVPIETVIDSEGELEGYRLERKKFYLPFLMVAARERQPAPPRPPASYGYRMLETLAFEPDELEAIAAAAARVRMLGDPLLASEAEAAIRKLALDLPLGAVVEARGVRDIIVPPRRTPEPAMFERLSDALSRRKRVDFIYYTIGRGEHAPRTVEPYGVFFVSSHWYLAGRDIERDAVRNFRLSRISQVKVNSNRSQSPDYEIPATFVLREHAQAREPWEIGDGDAREAIVEFVASTGATEAARRLGQPVPAANGRRRYEVRRVDAFARWLLSFGGDARPVSPPDLVATYERIVGATLARYEPGSVNGESPGTGPHADTGPHGGDHA
jgi:proteasome accessory factor B